MFCCVEYFVECFDHVSYFIFGVGSGHSGVQNHSCLHVTLFIITPNKKVHKYLHRIRGSYLASSKGYAENSFRNRKKLVTNSLLAWLTLISAIPLATSGHISSTGLCVTVMKGSCGNSTVR